MVTKAAKKVIEQREKEKLVAPLKEFSVTIGTNEDIIFANHFRVDEGNLFLIKDISERKEVCVAAFRHWESVVEVGSEKAK